MLEEGFDLEFKAGLAQDRVFVGLSGALEENALIVGGLPDRFVFVEAQEAGQRKGIAPVVFVGIVADEAVATGITDDELLDLGLKQLSDPAGEVGFFEHEVLDGGGDGLDVFEELLGIGGETPVIDFMALIVEVGQHAISGVGIQAEPCYRRSVSHNEPLVVVNRFRVGPTSPKGDGKETPPCGVRRWCLGGRGTDGQMRQQDGIESLVRGN